MNEMGIQLSKKNMYQIKNTCTAHMEEETDLT